MSDPIQAARCRVLHRALGHTPSDTSRDLRFRVRSYSRLCAPGRTWNAVPSSDGAQVTAMATAVKWAPNASRVAAWTAGGTRTSSPTGWAPKPVDDHAGRVEESADRLREHGLAEMEGDVQLVVSELATNALTHARTPFVVTIRGEASRVVLAVQDGSPVHPAVVKVEATAPGGRGLSIVDAVSHRWGSVVHPGAGKSVWASFALPPSYLS